MIIEYFNGLLVTYQTYGLITTASLMNLFFTNDPSSCELLSLIARV